MTTAEHTQATTNGHGPGRELDPARAPSRCPWNDVQHSWVDYVLLQKLSPTWASYRTALADSPALDVLDDVLEGGVREFVAAYRDEAGFLFNRAAVQLSYALDRTLRHRAAAPDNPAEGNGTPQRQPGEPVAAGYR